jgi:hypothetical protein
VKLILMIADAARLDEVRQDLTALGASGWTALPVTEGAGRTGVHAGDRVHPGALAALFVVESEARADTLFDALARRRREANDAVTRLFLLPVERIA